MDFDNHLMPDSTLEALKKLKENGIKLFVATGRPPNNIEGITKCFDFDGYLTSNGQYCYNDQEVIYEKYISKEDLKNIAPYIMDNNVPVLFADVKQNYSNIYNPCFDEKAEKVNQNKYPVKSIEEIVENNILQVIAYIKEEEDEAFLKMMNNSKSARWTSKFVDIIPKDGGKNIGIDQMIKYYNINIDEVMAFGDSNNDIDMLRHVGVGIAMGNGNDAVKEASDYVTDDINNDGLYKALEYFKLI